MFKTLLTAAAAAALMAGGAVAQSVSGTDPGVAAPSAQMSAQGAATATEKTPVGADASVGTSASTGVSSTTTPDGSAAATSATTEGANASVTTTTTTNGPVPDTAENRAKYGQPMSRAGKRTAPAGN